MALLKETPIVRPSIAVDVVEPGAGGRARKGRVRCQIGKNIKFNTDDLESYFFSAWDPIVFDALLVVAAVEFADRTQRRPALTWQREIALNIPVHDPERWNDRQVAETLQDALVFLTGDLWDVSFYKRSALLDRPQQGRFNLPDGSIAVIPFSDGLDSRAVAGLMARDMGDKLVRVRMGTKNYNGRIPGRQPFASVPYEVNAGAKKFVESSARSRGFKFALISGLAAYLAKAGQIIVPESGQGALGPAMVTVGQAYEDYRNHPFFTAKMEKFLNALLCHRVRFQFPRLWYTKGETLKKFVEECEDGATWSETWSCWQQNRHSSVDGKRRHCGICAACMLRRLSVHAAGLNESSQTYVWENLGGLTFTDSASALFAEKKKTGKMRHYAIAGALHMDHLANLKSSPANASMLGLSAFQLSRALNLPEAETREKLDRLLMQHKNEWKNFMNSLGQSSFITNWVVDTL